MCDNIVAQSNTCPTDEPHSADIESNDENSGKPKFPESLLYYLKMNAQPKLLLKLMKCSKYFWHKEFPYMIIHEAADIRIIENGLFSYLPNKKSLAYVNLDVTNLGQNLWLVDSVSLRSNRPHIDLFSKTIACDVKSLHLKNQIFTENNFKLLVSSGMVTWCEFNYCRIQDKDGTYVPLENFFQFMPKLEFLTWVFNDESAEPYILQRTQNIVKLLDKLPLHLCCLQNIPQCFSFSLLTKYMDKHPSVSFELHFGPHLSFAYTSYLQNYVNVFIEFERYKRRKIFINFPGQNASSYRLLFHNRH